MHIEDRGYRGSVARVEPYGIERIPAVERHGRVRDQFTVYFGASIGPISFVMGFLPVSFGLSLWESLSAIIIGSLLGGLMVGLMAVLGARTGIPTQVMGRGPLGRIGNLVPVTLVSLVSCIGWASMAIVIDAQALRWVFGGPFWVNALVIVVLFCVVAWFGYNMIQRVNRIATVVLALMLVVITVLALSKADYSVAVNPLAHKYIGQLGGWLSCAGLFAAYQVAWMPMASDYSRYLPSGTAAGKIVAATTLPLFASLAWMATLGLLVANVVEELDAINALAEVTGGLAPVVLLIIAASAAASVSLSAYGGALALLTLGVRVRREVAVAVAAIAAYLGALGTQHNLNGALYEFVDALARMIAPYMTLIALDYVMIRRTNPALIDEYFLTKPHFKMGFWIWIVSCALTVPFWVSPAYTGPIAAAHPQWGDLSYGIGMVIAAAVHLAHNAFLKGGRGGPASAQSVGIPSSPVLDDALRNAVETQRSIQRPRNRLQRNP